MIRIPSFILVSLLLASRAVPQSTFPSLLADGPAAGHAAELATFGQFVGSWTFQGVEYHDDGTRATDKGELHFHWILGGEAIQDVWLETERSDEAPKVLGTTIRFFDTKTGTWTCTWIHPRYATVRTITGRKVGDQIILEGTSASGERFRWIFSEISKESFRWHAESWTGRAWKTTEDLRATRMPRSAEVFKHSRAD